MLCYGEKAVCPVRKTYRASEMVYLTNLGIYYSMGGTSDTFGSTWYSLATQPLEFGVEPPDFHVFLTPRQRAVQNIRGKHEYPPWLRRDVKPVRSEPAHTAGSVRLGTLRHSMR